MKLYKYETSKDDNGNRIGRPQPFLLRFLYLTKTTYFLPPLKPYENTSKVCTPKVCTPKRNGKKQKGSQRNELMNLDYNNTNLGSKKLHLSARGQRV
jgi:hypothetical protein